MHRSKKGNIGYLSILTIIVLLLIAGVGAYYFSDKLFSIGVLGEEGYEPYDALLAAGSYDHNKWDCTAYTTATASNGNFILGAQQTPYTNPTQPICKTADLRLANWKGTVNMKYSGATDSSYAINNCLSTTKGPVFCRKPLSVYPYTASNDFVELTWNDYELGKYQIKVNGAIVQNGTVPPGEKFQFIITPAYASTSNHQSSVTTTIQSPRIKSLFSCDLQAGEVITNTCTTGPAVVELNDLKAFKRFCTDYPSKIIDNGLDRSSKQIYYDLAANKPVAIQAGEIYEFQYIADSATLGLPVDKTGIANQCVKPVLTEDLKDLPVAQAAVTGNTIEWTSSARYKEADGFSSQKLDMKSGTNNFMTTKPVQITCDYETTKHTYPGDTPASCFTVEAFGKPFRDGETIKINDYLSVTLKKLNVEYQRDTIDGKEYTYTARWLLTFNQDGAPVSGTVKQLTIKNLLPGPAQFITSADVNVLSLGERTISVAKSDVQPGETLGINVYIPSEFTGNYNASVRNVLQTEYGNIAFAPTAFTYNANDVAAAPATQSTTTHWWTTLWDFIKAIFTY